MSAPTLVHPALIDAVKNGDRAALKALLQKKADVNVADTDGSTALLWASYRDDLEAADLLLRAGAKVNAANDLNVTPLWPACQNGSAAMVRRLLDKGADPNTTLLSGETPLMVAARSGHPDVVELLVAKGANLNARGPRGQTALMWAVAQKHPDVIRVLLAHHADYNLKSDVYKEMMAVNPHGYLGVQQGDPARRRNRFDVRGARWRGGCGEALVAAGANVNDADAWGVWPSPSPPTPVSTIWWNFCSTRAPIRIRRRLVSPALQEAVLRRDERMVKALLDHKADPNTPVQTWTPTRQSSFDWHFEPSVIGATPLWLAARVDEPAIMQMLLDKGADPKFVHKVTWMADQGFAPIERTQTSTTLLAAVGIGGGNVQAWGSGNTRFESEPDVLASVKLLVDLGIDVNAASNQGATPLDGAKNLGYKSVVDFLTEKGAKAGTGAGGRRGRGGRGPAPVPFTAPGR